jgi:hypothetical protein
MSLAPFPAPAHASATAAAVPDGIGGSWTRGSGKRAASAFIAPIVAAASGLTAATPTGMSDR